MNIDAVAALDWVAAGADLNDRGFALLPPLLTPDDCAELSAMYDDDARFRSRIDMARFRFGAGEYKYFAAPLPPLVQRLRESLYAALVPTANRWIERMDRGPERPAPHASTPSPRPNASADRRGPGGGGEARQPAPHASTPASGPYPPTLDEFLERCHRAGQKRPTPLLLRYERGGYNCLHQDLYGELAFPLQVVILLGSPEVDFTGGEFLLVEQRPRAQSRGHAIAIQQGAAVVFATSSRPVAGTRGDYRVVMRHGVSTVTSGRRMTLGIIFHDAK